MMTETHSTKNQDKLPHLLTASDVANILGLGRSTVYQLLQRGELPCIRFGRSVRVHPDDLEKFIWTNTINVGSRD